MADQIDYKIIGDDMQAVVVALDHGERIQAEAGAMMFMESGIDMDTEMQGGVFGGIKRMIGGESFFLVSFTNSSPKKRRIAFAAPYPGKILALDLAETGDMICQRDAYLASAYGIEIEMAFTRRLGAGFFGGEGFILQRLSGDGLAFVHAGGTIISHTLDAGEPLRVDTGCIVAMESSVTYDITMVKGVKTMLFGGEGLFHAVLTGPGTVYMQTLPFSRLADRVIGASGFASKGEVRRGGGGILGQLLDGD